MSVQRIRMIGGPNGSGKSAILALLHQRNVPLGMYLNADDIERNLRGSGRHPFVGCSELSTWNASWQNWLAGQLRRNAARLAKVHIIQ
jgi:hypothetical protein